MVERAQQLKRMRRLDAAVTTLSALAFAGGAAVATWGYMTFDQGLHTTFNSIDTFFHVYATAPDIKTVDAALDPLSKGLWNGFTDIENGVFWFGLGAGVGGAGSMGLLQQYRLHRRADILEKTLQELPQVVTE